MTKFFDGYKPDFISAYGTKQGEVRDWQKDMEMCEKASPAPWKIDTLEYMGNRGMVHETVIDGVTSEIYNDEDAEFIAESRQALPYWLEETKKLCEVNQRKQRKILSLRARLSAAREREEQLREAIKEALSWTWNCGENNMTEVIAILRGVLTSLYPEKKGSAKTFTFDAIIYIYDGIRTTVQKPRLQVEAESEKDAEKKLSQRIHDNYKISSHLSLSSLQLELVEEGEA